MDGIKLRKNIKNQKAPHAMTMPFVTSSKFQVKIKHLP